MELTLEEVIATLAVQPQLPPVRNATEAIEAPALIPKLFSSPEFRLLHRSKREVSESLRPRVLLISAPAAVGKSYLAAAASGSSGNPLWNLAEFYVGSNFFTGTLAHHYGGSGYAYYEEALQLGRVTLILDAADEAVVSAGIANYEAAVKNLADLIGREETRSTAAVILGRPDTMEMTGVLLEEAGLSWNLFKVEYFSPEQSVSFVLSKMELAGGGAKQEATEFVNGFFTSVRAALPAGDESSRDFLGYAPVLDALARFYNQEKSGPNLHAALQRIKLGSTSDHVWSLLRDQVVNTICVRETEKLITNFSRDDSIKERIVRDLYGPQDQVRMLSQADLNDVTLEPPQALSEADQRALVDAWRNLFNQHPFLKLGAADARTDFKARFANQVFRDYVVAHVFIHGDTEVVEFIVDEASQPDFGPTPIAARFISAEINREGIKVLHPGVVGPLLDSVQADRTNSPLSVRVTETDEGRVRFELHAGGVPSAAFDVRSEGLGLALGRAISRTEIDCPTTTFVVPGAFRDFLLEGDLDIEVATLICDARSVRVQAGPEEELAVINLSASKFISSTERLYIQDPARVRLLSSSVLRYPWRPHSVLASPGDSVERELYLSGLQLKRLTQWFAHKSMTGRLTYPVPAMDTILNRGRASREMFDFLRATGRIERGDSVYRLLEPAPVSTIKLVDLSNAELKNFLIDFRAAQA